MMHKLIKECLSGIKRKGCIDEKFKKRLKLEIKEIEDQNMSEYFLEALENNYKWEKNENNLLIPYLLDLVSEVDIDSPPLYEHGEFPDIDIDYLQAVRDYLKKDWAPKTFGFNNICSIGNYTTYGLKSALIDMARVHGKSREEVLALTTKMGLKDDDGKALTWEKAVESNENFAVYCENNPDVAEAARRLVNRTRGRGTHAGGLIVSSSPINNLVPLCVGKDGLPVSAWTEGLHEQDLQPVGLIKFDMLVLSDLYRIACIVNSIKKRHGIDSICALPDQSDWTDLSYLNDKKALALANAGDTMGVFQFDSEGIRGLLKNGGVTSFDDMVAYNSLFRPGPLGMKMHERYCKRKKGEEEYEMHPLIKPILGQTYGVLCYQEQIMKMLNVVGDIPLKDCEIVRKAISKKKISKFMPYKEKFIARGQKNLNTNREELENIWQQIESFAEYGFNKSVIMSTMVPSPNGEKEIYKFKPGEKVYCVNEEGETVLTDVVQVHDHGVLDAFEVEFSDGYVITCSINHKFLTEKGQVPLKEIYKTHSPIMCDQFIGEHYAKKKERWLESSLWNDFPQQTNISKTQEELSEMQRSNNSREVGEIKTCGSLWSKVSHKSEIGKSPSTMSEMQENGLGKCYSQISVRDRIYNPKRKRQSSQKLQKLQSNQTTKYSKTNGEIKQGQQTSRSQEDIFRNSQENFCQTRNSSSTCCSTQEVERRKPKRICQMYRSSLEKSKTISNGRLASETIKLGFSKNSLWEKTKTSRFCKREKLDRSGRILSFLRTSKQWSKSVSTSCCSTTRQDVEGRMSQKKRCNVDSNRHDMFQEQFGCDARGMVQTVAEHAPISNTGRLALRRIVRVSYVGKKRMCDLEVANPTHNFLLPNGVVTSNSHACAYSYIAVRLLWLKAHYPIEFYSNTLTLENNVDKVKLYMNDAKFHDIVVNPVTINKSGANFEIHDDEIYYGLSKVKGIGPEVAENIVSNYPYKGIVDFMHRFGTDARVVQPLIALGAFDDADKSTLHKFYEVYKDTIKKRKDSYKRFMKSMEKYKEELEEIVGSDKIEEVWNSWKPSEKVASFDSFSITNQIFDTEKVWKKWKRTVERFLKKQRDFRESDSLTLKNFDPEQHYLSSEFEEIYDNPDKAEEIFYGFRWIHPIEKSNDYNNNYTLQSAMVEEGQPFTIQVMVLAYKKKTSRNNKTYFQLEVEDSNSNFIRINIWGNENERFGDEEFKVGNFLQLKLMPPSGGYKTYSLERLPMGWRERQQMDWKDPVYKDQDYRVIVMHKPESEKKTIEKEFADVGLLEID